MLSEAPNAAPCDTPRKPGSTSGLPRIICRTVPAPASDMPSSTAANTRGRRRFHTKRCASSSAASRAGVSKGAPGTGP